MTTILIVFFVWSYSGGATAVEFPTMDACRAGALAVEQKYVKDGWGNNHVFTICIPREPR